MWLTRRRQRIEQDIDDELGFHLEMRAESYLRTGMDRRRAEQSARDRFGNIDAIREECREVAMNFFDTLLQDLRYAWRTLAASRGFTAAALASVALGIGATTTIFSIVNSVLLERLPFRDPDRIVVVWESWLKNPGPNKVASATLFDWKLQSQVFDEFAAMHWHFPVTLTGGTQSEEVEAQRVSGNFFPLLGVQPVLGRNFAADEDRAQVILLSHEFWQRKFAGDRNIIGKRLAIDGQSHTIVGVMPPGIRLFRVPGLPQDPTLWLPLPNGGASAAASAARSNLRWLHVIARLKAGVSLPQAQSSMDLMSSRLAQENPQFYKGWGIQVEPLHEAVVGNSRTPLLVLMGAVAFVLLIASANVANLLLARASAREREFAVRAALGGARRRLIRQLLTESALLSLGGGILGFLLALGGVRALVNMAPPETIPRAEEIGVNFIVLGFSLGVSLLTGLIFGLAPAWHASKANLNDSFKTMGRASTAGRGAQRTRGFLVALEIAVASVLLVGAGLMIRTFVRLEAVDPGFKTENVITMQAHLPRFKYARPTGKRVGKSNDLIAITPELPIRIEQMLSKIESIAGVEIAGATSALPMTVGQGGRAFQIEGRPKLGPGERWPAANYAAVSPNYLRTMGIPLLNGRHFTESDSENAGRVAIVSKSTALRYWPGENPVGKQILIDDLTQMESTRQIVGVVGDVRTFKLDEEPGRLIYVPYAQQPRFYPHTAYHERHFVNFTIRTRMDPAPVIAMARKAIAESDPDAPVSDVRTLRQVVAAQTIRPRFYMALLSAFAGMALFLAAVGIYAVMAYSVNQRIHEIGVRMALGARRGDVLKLVLMQYSLVAVGGLSVGLAASLYLTRFISGWLYGVRATDPATLAAASFVLITAAMLGCYIPAHRAMGMDPMAALRHE